MLVFYILVFGISLANSQSVELSKFLEQMENSVSNINLRMARIEARQTRNMMIYSQLEESIKKVKSDLDSKHGETMLWLKNVVNLLNDLKVKYNRQEAAQSIMSDSLQRMINKTDRCCRNDTVVITCPNQATVSSIKPGITDSTSTLRLTNPASTSTTKTTTSSTISTTTSSTKTPRTTSSTKTPRTTSATTPTTTSSTTSTTTSPTTTQTTTVRLTTQISTSATPTTTSPTTTIAALPGKTNCKTVNQRGAIKEGVYKLDLPGKRQVNVYCSAGYMTIQRRFSGAVSFDRTFAEYEQGFGDVSGEHWLGLIYLHELTKSQSKGCKLQIQIEIDSQTQWNRARCGDSSDCDGAIKSIGAENFRIYSASSGYRMYFYQTTTSLNQKEEIMRTRQLSFSTKKGGYNLRNRRCAGYGEVPAGFWYDNRCMPGHPNTVWVKSNPYYCSSWNKVCGYWAPYYFISSWIMFTC